MDPFPDRLRALYLPPSEADTVCRKLSKCIFESTLKLRQSTCEAFIDLVLCLLATISQFFHQLPL